MAKGIKDKVVIIGMGCSKFGERWDKEADNLMVEAYTEAIADAGIDTKQIDAAWLATADLEQQKRICVDLQKQLCADVPFIPMGEYWQTTAYRKDITGALPGCFTVFYNVRRA